MTSLHRAIRSRAMLQEIAVFIQTRIYQNTKRGYYAGVRKNLAKFRPLSEGYVAARKALLKGGESSTLKKLGLKKTAKKLAKNNFGEFFSPARSNLTMTGQMLDALQSAVDAGKGQVTISVSNTSRKGEDLTNAQVAVRVAEAGRPFLGLDGTGRDRVVRMVIADLRRGLKRR